MSLLSEQAVFEDHLPPRVCAVLLYCLISHHSFFTFGKPFHSSFSAQIKDRPEFKNNYYFILTIIILLFLYLHAPWWANNLSVT